MKKIFQKAAIAAALAMPMLASADVIQFDMNGGGDSFQQVDLLDWTVGNALAVNGNPNGGLIIPDGGLVLVGTQTQLLYQANLGSVSLGGAPIAAAGLGGAQSFTVVAGFQEEVLGTSTATNFNFGLINPVLAPTTANFFYIYANTFGNNLAGTGFVGGTLVMSGYISQVLSSNFGTAGVTGLFDNANGDDYGGFQSLYGAGANNIRVTISSYDTNYFRGLLAGNVLSLAFTNTSVVTPFDSVDPSRLFSSTGLLNGDLASNLGGVNGVDLPGDANSYNFQFQGDANTAFRTTSVPEPGSLALVGLALGAVGFVSRRRTSKKA